MCRQTMCQDRWKVYINFTKVLFFVIFFFWTPSKGRNRWSPTISPNELDHIFTSLNISIECLNVFNGKWRVLLKKTRTSLTYLTPEGMLPVSCSPRRVFSSFESFRLVGNNHRYFFIFIFRLVVFLSGKKDLVVTSHLYIKLNAHVKI